MARRVPENQNEQSNAPAAQPTAEGIPGGSAGILTDAATAIVNPTEPVAHAEGSEDAPEVTVKRYRVKNDPPAGKTGFPVLYDGCLTHLPKGKIVTENAYDIEKLKSQGVELEEF